MRIRFRQILFILFLILVLATSSIIEVVSAAAGPDIIGTRLVLPSPLKAGDTGELQDFIKNQGSTNAGQFEVSYFLNRDPSRTDGEILIGTWDVAGLKAGALKNNNTTITVPSDLEPGEYYLLRVIDPAGVLPGELSSNNIQRSKVPIEIIQRSDTGVKGTGTIIPQNAESGSMIPVSVIIENTRDNETDPVPVYFFLSPSEQSGSSLVALGSLMTHTIQPGEEEEISGTIQIPEDTPAGEYSFFTSLVPADEMTGDGTSSTFWYNEDPLIISAPQTPQQNTVMPVNQGLNRPPEADVIGLGIEVPTEAFIGDSFDVTDSVKNIGGSTASIVRVEYGLASEPDGKDSTHIGWWTPMDLKPDQTLSNQNPVGVPSDMRPGLYYLTKKISVTASPPELKTGNNWWVSNMPINIRYNPADPIPELTHIKTVWPTGQPGETVQITDTVTNIGRACASNVAVAYYISPYPEFDAATATYLGVWNVPSICPGQQITNPISVTIPSDLTNGEYYYYSIIDPCTFISDCGDGIPEPDKSNNINIGRLYIGPCTFCG